MRATFAAAVIALLGVAALVNVTAGQEHIQITALICESNPEVVSIKNLGSAPQSLTGWKLRSDPVDNAGQVFDLSEAGSLDAGEEISVFSGSSAPATNASLGQYRWALSFKLRNDDPTDFAQVVDENTTVIDQVNCGETPVVPTPAPPTLTPTLTASPTAPSTTVAPTETATVPAAPSTPPPPSATPTNVPAISATPLSTSTSVPTPTPPVGDADCSGSVTSIDAALVLQLSAGLVASLSCEEFADANEDGELNSIDAALILQFVAGLLDSLPP